MKIVKKIRIFPTVNQKNQIDFWFRRCTVLWNVAFEQRQRHYYVYGKTKNALSGIEQQRELKFIKQEIPSWKDVPKSSLQGVLQNLDVAYSRFFKKTSSFPNFKSTKDTHSIKFCEQDVRNFKGKLFIPKIKTNIKYKGVLPELYKNVYLTKDKYIYHLVFNVSVDEVEFKDNGEILGIDLGLKSLWTTSDGEVQKRFPLKLYNNYQKRIKTLNQSLAKKKEKKSKRRNKVKKQLAKAYKRLKNSREDFLHKGTTKLVKNEIASIIVCGDIQVNQLVDKKNKKSRKGLRKSFYNAGLGKVKQQLAYKSQKFGKRFELVNEAYTSKTCSGCGEVNFSLRLSDREYICKCGIDIDRDLNGAINIKNVWLGQFRPIGLNSRKLKIA